MKTHVLAFFILMLCGQAASGQRSSPVIDSMVVSFGEKSQVRGLPAVYLHLDKTIYVRNEHIWFTAYLLNGSPETEQTLYVALTDPMKKEVLVQSRFVMSKYMGQGYLMVPDSLESGEYRLVAYTSSYLKSQQQEVFQQAISIRAPDKSRIIVNDLSGPVQTGQPLSLKYKVTNYEQKPADKEPLIYRLYDGNHLLDSGRKQTDIWGEVQLKLPPAPDSTRELVMDINTSYKKEPRNIRIPLQVRTPLRVRWFAEGGSMVAYRRSRMAFEISENGRALSAQGELLAAGLPVATFRSNTAGRGWLYFVPMPGVEYSLKLLDRKEAIPVTLPDILPDGYTLYVENALPEDTLDVTIHTPDNDSSCFVALHNYHDIYFSGAILLPRHQARIRLPMHEVPRGLVTLTLFSGSGEPVAERAILAHNSQRLQVNITTDSAQYHTRSKVKVKVKVTNSKGEPVRGMLSAGLALDKRVDTLRFRDIDRYYYFEQHLPSPAILPGFRFFDDERQLEELLLTKCWTRYRKDAPPLPPSVIYEEDLHGQLLLNHKPVKKPGVLLLIGTGKAGMISTDSSGRFTIPVEQLRAPADSRIAISAVGGQKRTELQDYTVELNDPPYDTLNRALTGIYIPYQPLPEDILSADEKIKMKTMLKEVVVKSRNDDHFGEFRSQNCNDWVCQYNILNCSNHPYGSKPQSGATYNYRGQPVVYRACKEDSIAATGFMKKVDGIWYSKEFYVADYSTNSAPDPEMFTTVYWNHGAMIHDNGEVEFSFYTNDLTGRFCFIIEGFTDQGLMSGRTWFKVANE